MASKLIQLQAGLDAQDISDVLAGLLPEAGVQEIVEAVKFLNDENNRAVRARYNKNHTMVKKTLMEHVTAEDVGDGLRIRVGDVGEIVMAPQTIAKRAARPAQPERKGIRVNITKRL